MDDGTFAGFIHQTGCADLYADRLKRFDFRSLGIIESDVERTHVSDLIFEFALDRVSVFFRIHFDDFHRRAFGEGFVAKFDYDSCAVLVRRLEAARRQVKYLRLFNELLFGEFFAFSQLFAFGCGYFFSRLFCHFLRNNFLSRSFYFFYLSLFQLLYNVSNQRRIFGGLFDRFFSRFLCSGFFLCEFLFYRFLSGGFRLFGSFLFDRGFFLDHGSFGTVIVDDGLSSFCDQSAVNRFFCYFSSFLFGFLGLFLRLFFEIGFFRVAFFESLVFEVCLFGFAFGGFCFFFEVSVFRGFGFFAGLFDSFLIFGNSFCLFGFAFDCFCILFEVCVGRSLFRLFDSLCGLFCFCKSFFLAGGRSLDVFCDFLVDDLGLGRDYLFAGLGQIFRKYGISACSHDGEHHYEYQDESQYASPACGSIQLTHTAFLSINSKRNN